MTELENKYIDLILKRCLNFKNTNSLLINCDLKEHLPFAEKVKKRALELGISDIYININDLYEVHDYLLKTNIKDIKNNKIIDRSKWDEYAKKGGCLLFLTSTIPNLMKDIDNEKLTKLAKERIKTISYYKENVAKYLFPWCIVSLPNEKWAKEVFNNDPNAYQKLYLSIMKMCMVDKEDSIKAWSDYIKSNNIYKEKLNNLKISYMHYKNSLGTDLTVKIPDKNTWMNLDKNSGVIVNMPSYEIFTTPDYRETNGIVYSSKPLIYDENKIENFWIKFENGIAVDCHAEVGEKYLKNLLNNFDNTKYLGEVALVPYDSPISNTGVVYNSTLYDENASCHLALGRGFPNTFYNGKNLTADDLKKLGCNISNYHVDFMIGTSDLEIEADTIEGKKLIFKNGNFNI